MEEALVEQPADMEEALVEQPADMEVALVMALLVAMEGTLVVVHLVATVVPLVMAHLMAMEELVDLEDMAVAAPVEEPEVTEVALVVMAVAEKKLVLVPPVDIKFVLSQLCNIQFV